MDRGSPLSEAEQAMARVTAALERIEAAAKAVGARAETVQNAVQSESAGAAGSSAKVMALVNKHEAMREEVASTMRDLDSIITKLEI